MYKDDKLNGLEEEGQGEVSRVSPFLLVFPKACILQNYGFVIYEKITDFVV
jgi:hypothetical protein